MAPLFDSQKDSKEDDADFLTEEDFIDVDTHLLDYLTYKALRYVVMLHLLPFLDMVGEGEGGHSGQKQRT